MKLWFERAYLAGAAGATVGREDGGLSGVAVTVGADGRVASVAVDVAEPSDPAVRCYAGLALPGAQNAHSHAFHRLLRGRTHGDGGSFWTWRDVMYRAAAQLTPENYFDLACAVFAEMVAAGYTAVGEFHYVHHRPNGTPYPDHDMELALARAAAAVGIRLTLLDTCYLAGGIAPDGTYLPLGGEQARFSDGSIEGFLDRHSRLALALDSLARSQPAVGQLVTLGAAIHSVRAVPRETLPAFRELPGPLHVHLSEQPAENEACQSAHGMSPTELLAEAGLLSPRLSAVHATHLSAHDIELLSGAGVHIVMCPTTEADLADGIGPAHALAHAGAVVALGSDQHVVLDPLLEARGLEAGERLASGQRGCFSPEELVAALSEGGAGSLRPGAVADDALVDATPGVVATTSGLVPGGSGFAPGALADYLVLDTGSVRTIGSLGVQAVLAATSADVRHVLVGGREVARDGEHIGLGSVAELYREALAHFEL
ncbi:formimidoylglutamate deiminase [Brevibacterium sp. 50QC2O2]|uniref:formimidoylglutamate deiminase n=1 Tax=unclassified Brevibacterium TaxID=2614124 RepID=UPI00211CDC80|nr:MULTISPECIES: formimidoylglutamate deiminase [unclassified Brevibacterium]MCQ9367050.1 formimidoylglutamate deiminase [Brevibacterium sp. 91QC2O2]MCQ9388266.1 formimidoylglutamate deiminase [Brevibacterium sp. 50QC2O2]